MSTTEQKFGVFEMPYLIVSRAHMKKVAENKQTQSALLERLPARGMRILGGKTGFAISPTTSGRSRNLRILRELN
jgi:TRAP-type C4-dicarboxylate transport system substrate-binding protein